MCLCICSSGWFEAAFENSFWRKIVQMQPMPLCICSCSQFENTHENSLEKNHTNATNATLHLHMQTIWGDIWKLTVGKCNKSNFAFANRGIWKYVEEQPTNVFITSVNCLISRWNPNFYCVVEGKMVCFPFLTIFSRQTKQNPTGQFNYSSGGISSWSTNKTWWRIQWCKNHLLNDLYLSYAGCFFTGPP